MLKRFYGNNSEQIEKQIYTNKILQIFIL